MIGGASSVNIAFLFLLVEKSPFSLLKPFSKVDTGRQMSFASIKCFLFCAASQPKMRRWVIICDAIKCLNQLLSLCAAYSWLDHQNWSASESDLIRIDFLNWDLQFLPFLRFCNFVLFVRFFISDRLWNRLKFISFKWFMKGCAVLWWRRRVRKAIMWCSELVCVLPG